MLTSGFEDIQLDGITLDISSAETKYAGTLERITLDRTEVRRGEKVEVQAYVRTESGKQFVQRIPVQIPEDAAIGQLLVFVGDGGALQEGSAAKSFVPQDLSQLVRAINTVKKSDRLYVKLFRITNGAVIGTSELPSLPPSMVATLEQRSHLRWLYADCFVSGLRDGIAARRIRHLRATTHRHRCGEIGLALLCELCGSLCSLR